MERTNVNLVSELLRLRNVASSWQSHADEWEMTIDTYSGILRRINDLYDRERKAAFEMLKAAKELLASDEENADNGAALTIEDYAKRDGLRYALAEKLYVYSRIMGETDFAHAIDDFTCRGGKMMFKHSGDEYNGKVVMMTLEDMLEYVNADRNSEWQDYDDEDWQEGMLEWTDLDFVRW
jgi:hypothetical protein